MAYTKQTWLDRVGTFLNRFTKSNETLSSVELVNNPDTITQAGTAFSASRMNYMESGIEAAHRIATPLSDLSRVMRINGDGVPTFPDNVAGTVYKRVNNFSQTDIMTTNGSPAYGKIGFFENGEFLASRLSIYNGTVKIVAETNENILRLSISVISKQVRIAIVPASDTTLFVNNDGSVGSGPEVKQGVLNWIDITFNETGAGFIDIEHLPVGNNYICGLYIGSGLYDTPVYGKDGRTAWINTGVLPVNESRGNGLLFPGTKFLETTGSILGTSGAIAFRYNRKTIGTNESVVSNLDYSAHMACIYI